MNHCAWFEMSWCDEHQEVNCDCGHRLRTWRLKCSSENFGGTVQQFASGAYYGTWECGDGGRTGPMTDLDECKHRVEENIKKELS